VNDTTEAPKRAQPSQHRIVGKLRRILADSDRGTLAALRRMRHESPPAAFYRVIASVDELDDLLFRSRRDEGELRWAVVVSVLACGVGLFNVGTSFGEALAAAGVAEMRMLRLLEAHDETLAALVQPVVHQLVQKAQPFNPHELADLVLSDGTEHARAPRRRIARKFYQHSRT
jgi:hypothetical protein